tara:strand:+ start:17864 stop:18058 length:195 start_codon:yes stop_codon:yes gene_type:complete
MTRNHTGHPTGQHHHRAKLTTEQVQAMRAEYIPYVNGLTKLARKYQCPRSTVRDICNYMTRTAG